MNSREVLEPFIPPRIEDFLKEKCWAIHEAAFILTEWPQYNLFSTRVHSIPDRFFIYLPDNIEVNPTLYGTKFEDIFNDLNESIENGDLPYTNHRILDTMRFVSPSDVVIWALMRGHILSNELQEAIGVRQDTSTSHLPSKTQGKLPTKVQEKILAQFILAKDPNQKRKDLYKNVLKRLGKEEIHPGIRRDLTAVRNNLNELYDSPEKKGRRKDSEKFNESYTPKAIQEVMRKDQEGYLYYNFPLLVIAMTQAAFFMMGSMHWDDELEINKKKFATAFFLDDVVHLYLQKNEYVLRIMLKCIDKVWGVWAFLNTTNWIDRKIKEHLLQKPGIEARLQSPGISENKAT